MITRERLLEVMSACLKHSRADQVEVVVLGGDTYLTRYATNYIHQNTAESGAEVYVRSILGRKVGVATTTALDEASLQSTVESSERIAEVQPEQPDEVSLPAPEDAGGPVGSTVFAQRTASFTPEERAAGIARITGLAARNGFQSAGAFRTSVLRFGVLNSRGIERYGETTRAGITAIVMGPTGSGYAEDLAVDAGAVNLDLVAETAVRKCRDAQDPIAVQPGDYEVILEPAAVADMIMYLGFMGLGAKAVQEGRSFATGRLGQKVTGEQFTLWDDGNDPSGLPFAFDFEGVKRQRVMLIEQGVARGVVYDTSTARREPGKKSTGHALPPNMTHGALPLNLFIAEGDSSIEEMIRGMKRGLLITRFHYVNPLHPVLTTITGMTRDGTFLVEDGKIKGPVKNMRFTNSILEALDGVEALSKTRTLNEAFGFGAIAAPAIKCSRFSFTGATQF